MRITSILLLLLLLPGLLCAQASSVAYVNVPAANVRSNPNTDSEVINKFSISTKITIGRRKGDWVEVIMPDNSTGWIYGTLLSDSPPKEENNGVSLLGIHLGCTEREVLDILGSPDNVHEKDGRKIYEYGSLQSFRIGYNSALGVYFKEGKVFRIIKTYAGSMKNADSFPYLVDRIPESFLEEQYTVYDDNKDSYYQHTIQWKFGDTYFRANSLIRPVREYDSDKGYIVREPYVDEIRVCVLTISEFPYKKK